MEDKYAEFRVWGRLGGLKNRHQDRGGKARAKKLSKSRRSEIARMGGKALWEKLKA